MRARAEAEALSGLAGADARRAPDADRRARPGPPGVRHARGGPARADRRRRGGRRGERPTSAGRATTRRELRRAVRRRPDAPGPRARSCSPPTGGCWPASPRPPRAHCTAAGWPRGRPRRRSSRPPTGCAPRCSPASATTCAPRWPSVKAAVSSLRQDDVAWTPAETRRAAGDHRGRRRPAAGARRQPARRLPPARPAWCSASLERVRLEELVGRALLGLGSLDRVDLDIPEDLPDVLADVGLAERVLANVLENALRHGGAGARDRPRARSRATAPSSATWSTTGPGVPAARGRAVRAVLRRGGRGPGRSATGAPAASGWA